MLVYSEVTVLVYSEVTFAVVSGLDLNSLHWLHH